MTSNAQRIAELLHLTRSAAWTSDDSLALSAALKSATADDCHLALLTFSMSMLAASRGCLLIQRDAALLEETLAERDEAGGPLQ